MKMTKSGGDGGGGGGNPKKLRRGNQMFNEMPIVSSRVLNTDDRISRLPDSVICHILSFLETKLVVTTSILSKRWKFVWTGVTALDFEEQGIDSDDEDLDEETKDRILVQNNGIKDIVQFVDKVLLHQNVKSLDKFQLTGRKGCKRDFVHVNRWISYAIMRDVKSLTIAVSGSVKIHLPAEIFTSGMLSYLNLSRNFMLKLPPVVCLPKLEHLRLYYIVIESDECVSKLLSGCPVLHSLMICRHSQDKVLVFRVPSPSLKRLEVNLYPSNNHHSDYDGKLAIDAPNLEYLEIEDCISCEVSITRLTAAKSVHIDLELIFTEADTDECNSVVKLVDAVNSVQFLKLRGRIMRYLSHATIPLLATFDRLTKLSIHCECCHWSSLSVLLGCLMKLETLEITRKLCFGETVEHCWKDPEEVPSCLSSTLARISISSFDGLDDEMEMIMYVLKHGAVLKLIDLQVCRRHSIDLKLEMLQAISTFPRLSSACSIKYT